MNSNTCTTKINNKSRDKAKSFTYIKSFKESYMYNKISDKALKAQKRNCI